MEKVKLNYLVDLLMGIFFLVVAVSGVILFFFLPSGVRRGGYQEFLGIERHTLVSLHNWCGLILIILIAVHFVLHWRWILEMTKKYFKRQ